MKNSQLMVYMVSLHFIDLISWGVLNNGPLHYTVLHFDYIHILLYTVQKIPCIIIIGCQLDYVSLEFGSV
jgi:hypothetical protein